MSDTEPAALAFEHLLGEGRGAVLGLEDGADVLLELQQMSADFADVDFGGRRCLSSWEGASQRRSNPPSR